MRFGWIPDFALIAFRRSTSPPIRSHHFYDLNSSDLRPSTIALFRCSAWQSHALMDYTRVTSPPSIRVHDHNGTNHGRRRSTSRSAGVSIPRSPAPMAIPSSRPELPPPPLPPPRFIDDITAGSDPGWTWGNDPSGSFGKPGGSSMAGTNFPKSWGNRPEDKRQTERSERPEYRRRQSSNTTIKSPTDTDRRYDFSRQQDEGYYSVSGPRPSAMTQQQLVYKFPYRSLPYCRTPLRMLQQWSETNIQLRPPALTRNDPRMSCY